MAVLQRLSQGQRQQQKADPQLLLTNRVLQMSAMELRQCIVQEMSDNPALEQPEDSGCNDCVVPSSQCLDCPQYLARLRGTNERNSTQPATGREEIDPLSLVENPVTLHDHLRAQLRAVCADEEQVRVGEYLIANITPDGYFRGVEDEAVADLGVLRADVDAVLTIIQAMDPSGVGARSLQECLLIQHRALELDGEAPALAGRILEDYFKELCAGNVRRLARALRSKPEVVEEAVHYIQHYLSPYPGLSFRPAWDKSSHRSAQAVRPDVVVSKDELGELVIEVLDTEGVQLQLNPYYAQMFQQVRANPESYSPGERRHIQEFLHRAQMFLKSLQDRKTILRQVAECLLDEQRAYFFTEREEDMSPLTQSQLAGYLRVHESTVSRCVADKFLQLPSGQVVALEYFFDRSLSVRKLVANLIAKEDRANPYSDQELSEMLSREGVQIARRTVMKYREEMNILSSRQRART